MVLAHFLVTGRCGVSCMLNMASTFQDLLFKFFWLSLIPSEPSKEKLIALDGVSIPTPVPTIVGILTVMTNLNHLGFRYMPALTDLVEELFGSDLPEVTTIRVLSPHSFWNVLRNWKLVQHFYAQTEARKMEIWQQCSVSFEETIMIRYLDCMLIGTAHRIRTSELRRGGPFLEETGVHGG